LTFKLLGIQYRCTTRKSQKINERKEDSNMMNNTQNINEYAQYITNYSVYKEMLSLFSRKRKPKVKGK
jgi:hypothetical protein